MRNNQLTGLNNNENKNDTVLNSLDWTYPGTITEAGLKQQTLLQGQIQIKHMCHLAILARAKSSHAEPKVFGGGNRNDSLLSKAQLSPVLKYPTKSALSLQPVLSVNPCHDICTLQKRDNLQVGLSALSPT